MARQDTTSTLPFFPSDLTIRTTTKCWISRKITTAEKRNLYGVAQGVLRDNVVDDNGERRLVHLSRLIRPGLRRNLSTVKDAARNGTVSTFDTYNQKLERTISPFPKS